MRSMRGLQVLCRFRSAQPNVRLLSLVCYYADCGCLGAAANRRTTPTQCILVVVAAVCANPLLPRPSASSSGGLRHAFYSWFARRRDKLHSGQPVAGGLVVIVRAAEPDVPARPYASKELLLAYASTTIEPPTAFPKYIPR